jgi:sortase A
MDKQQKRRIKKLILLSISICLVVTGLWFTGTNGFKFIKGYFLFTSGNIDLYEGLEDTLEVVKTNNEAKAATLYPERPNKGDLIGHLYIPKLDATLPIYHGTDEDELEKGVGHFMGSVLPGENDNSVLSGHRDTVFRRLGEVGEKDLLIVTTSAGEFTYRVKKVRIVDADDRTVIVPKPRATLTVSTCYPFDFIGSAPERYILEAQLVQQQIDGK